MKRFFTHSLLVLLCIAGNYTVSTAQNTQEDFEGHGFTNAGVTAPFTVGSFVYDINSGGSASLGTVTGPVALWVGLVNSFSIKKTDRSAFRFVSFHADDASGTQPANITGYLKGVLVAGPVSISIPINQAPFDFSTQSHFDDVDSIAITGTSLDFYLEDWTYNLSPVAYAPFISTNPVNKTVCAGSNTSFTVAGTDAPTSYTWQYSSNNGSSWTTITAGNAGSTYTNYTAATLNIFAAAALNGYQYRASATNAIGTSAYSNAGTLTVITSATWNGSNSNSWITLANWTGGCLPSSTIDAVVPAVSRQPVVPGGRIVNVRNLTVASGASITIASGSELDLYGSAITNNGSVKGAGSYLSINNDGLQTTLSGNGTYGIYLQLNSNVGAAVGNTTNDTVKIASGGELQLLSGTFVSRDKLMLVGDATGCGAIGNVSSPSTITGKVIISNYTLTAQRGYRAMGHPFTDNIPLSSLLPYIDISGASGFTAGAGANPSAYSFNPATSTGTGGSGGWVPYTDASQTWNQGSSLLLFVRGKAGEGLNTPYGYSISAPTISLTGTVNIASPNIVLQSSASTAAGGWNMVPNVMPTPVYVHTSTINNLTSAGISTSVYLWNPLKGRTRSDSIAGGYDNYFITQAPVIPMFSAFFIKNTSTATGGAHVGDITISYDAAGASAAGNASLQLLGGSAPYTSGITFTLESDNGTIYWDKLYLLFQKDATTKDNDKDDFEKMNNAGLNMYAIADSNKYLAVDARPEPVTIDHAIAWGITTQQQRLFTLKASDVITNNTLYLHDKYTETWTKITNDMQYQFAVTADSNTKGNNRFEIAPKVTAVTPPADSTVTVTPTTLTLKAGPNPVQSQLTISYTLPAAAPAAIVITNTNGQVIHTIDAGTAPSGTKTVNTGNWAAGVYFVQLKTSTGSITKQIVKE